MPHVILWPAYPAGCPVLSRRGLFPGLSGAEKSIMRTRAARDIRVLVSVWPGGAARRARNTARTPLSDPATGETYHVEIGGYFWNPTPDISITSQSLTRDALGTPIDFVKDLGIEQTRFKQLKVVLRPGTQAQAPVRVHADQLRGGRHAEAGHRLQRAAVSTISLPVSTDLQWKAYRFVYEYDFVYRDRGFFGAAARDEVHRRARRAHQPGRRRVRQREGADSDDRRSSAAPTSRPTSRLPAS